jgi:hypothetical protein
VRQADRATYLLNYLYMNIQSCQLLVDNWQRENCQRLNTLKECFVRCLKPYHQILSDWISKGDEELFSHDLKTEFFIKANHRLFVGDNAAESSRKVWQDSYVFRTINISKLLGQGLIDAEFGDLLQADADDDMSGRAKRHERIEISCPTFLRPVMRQILSVGKSIKIVRYLETRQIMRAGTYSILDDLVNAVDFDDLCRQNLRVAGSPDHGVLKNSAVDYQSATGDGPCRELSAIAQLGQNVEALQEDLLESLKTFKKFGAAPFQWTLQRPALKESNPSEDVEMDAADQDLAPRGFYSGIFKLSEVLRDQKPEQMVQK